MSAVARSNRPAPKLLPEFVGTFTFVFIDAGAAAVVRDDVGSAGIAALALAHGLVTMAFAVAFRERARNFRAEELFSPRAEKRRRPRH